MCCIQLDINLQNGLEWTARIAAALLHRLEWLDILAIALQMERLRDPSFDRHGFSCFFCAGRAGCFASNSPELRPAGLRTTWRYFYRKVSQMTLGCNTPLLWSTAVLLVVQVLPENSVARPSQPLECCNHSDALETGLLTSTDRLLYLRPDSERSMVSTSIVIMFSLLPLSAALQDSTLALPTRDFRILPSQRTRVASPRFLCRAQTLTRDGRLEAAKRLSRSADHGCACGRCCPSLRAAHYVTSSLTGSLRTPSHCRFCFCFNMICFTLISGGLLGCFASFAWCHEVPDD
jgi:hypothetical protein